MAISSGLGDQFLVYPGLQLSYSLPNHVKNFNKKHPEMGNDEANLIIRQLDLTGK
jgi:hypothetical protein